MPVAEASTGRFFFGPQDHRQRHCRDDDCGNPRCRQALPFDQRSGRERRRNAHAACEAVIDANRTATLNCLGPIGDERGCRHIGGGPAKPTRKVPSVIDR